VTRLERTVTVVPEAGLHARPASLFVRAANQYAATVQAGRSGEDLVDAASMIAVTSLGVDHGEELRIVAEGDDAEAALDAVELVLTTPEGELADDDVTPDE